jgi:hypothetical protein
VQSIIHVFLCLKTEREIEKYRGKQWGYTRPLTAWYVRLVGHNSINSVPTLQKRETGLRAERSGAEVPTNVKRFFSYSKRPDRLWRPGSLLFIGYCCSLPGIKRSGRDVDLSPPCNAKAKNE